MRSVFGLWGCQALSAVQANLDIRTGPNTEFSSTTVQWPAQQPFQQQQQQQQQWTPDLGQQQAALMRGLLVLQQPCRCFSSSAAAAGRHKDAAASWLQSPRLHQPTKHVSGTDPLRTLQAANGTDTLQPPGSSTEAASEAATSSAGSNTKQPMPERLRAAAAEQWQSVRATAHQMRVAVVEMPWHRLGQVGAGIMLLATGTCSAYVLIKQAVLDSCAGRMRSNDSRLQRLSLERLRVLLDTPAWLGVRSDVAHQLLAKELLPEIVALIQPGTDAMVLNEMFLLFQELLDFGGGMKQGLQKAGVMQAMDKALTEGWLPRGALDSAQALKARLMRRGLPSARES